MEKLVNKKEVEELREENTRLTGHVADLTQEVKVKSDEIRGMKSRTRESLERIQSFIGNSGDVVNKARLFDNDIRTGGHPFAPKIIAVLVEFGRKMEATLSDMGDYCREALRNLSGFRSRFRTELCKWEWITARYPQ